MLSNLDLIRRVPLFTLLTAAQAKSLSGAVAKQRFKRGEALFEQGKTSDALYIILMGRVRVLMTDKKGREVILATLAAGDYIGEMSLIDNQAHSATVVAEVPTDTLVLGREEFARCLVENASMAQAVMRVLVKRLRSADQKISALALNSVYERVANVLLEASVVGDDGELRLREKISRQDVAKMVGASREMVSRVMKDFEEQGFVEICEDGIVRVFERRMVPR
jgi:CRP-like cAMP-binding protein